MELRVGGVYRNRMGEVKRIVLHDDKNPPFIFKDEYDGWYKINGDYLINNSSASDLIEEITEQQTDNVMQVRMEGKYKTRDGNKIHRVLCIDALGKQPVVVEWSDGITVTRHSSNGMWDIDGKENPNDLIEIVEPKYRAWTYDEIPLGATVRHKTIDIGHSLITSKRPEIPIKLVIGNGWITTENALKDYEFLLDGEWQPCGVIDVVSS